MANKFPVFGIATICITMLVNLWVPAQCQTADQSWSVSASNWMQYWYHQPEKFDSLSFGEQSRQDSLDNRLIVDFNLGNFYAGAWLRIFEPNSPDTSYERITQRYFGWENDGLSLRVGNFYQTFDRGLTLNTFYDDVINYDNNLDGVRVSGLYDHYDFDALSGRGINFSTGKRKYTIRAVRGAIRPIDGFKVGSSYVRFKQISLLEFGEAENTNLTAINTEINKGPIGLYAEYASKKGENEVDEANNGDGTYLSASFSQKFFSVYAEYKNIIRLLYPGPSAPFNNPPPVSHQGRTLSSVESTPGERAYQVGSLISPSFNLNFDLAYSESFSRGLFPGKYLAEKYAGVRWSPMEKLTSNYHFDRHDLTRNSPDSLPGFQEDEIENYVDAYYYLTGSQTVSATAYTRRFITSGSYNNSYHENYLTLGFAQGSLFQVNFGGSTSNKKNTRDPKRMAFIEFTIHFKSNDLVVFQGGERGGLICSSGICSLRPTFRGTRVMLYSRF